MAGKRWAYIPAYWKFNLAMALEYKASFLSQVLAMALNDGLWVIFWSLFFHKFPSVAGWGLADVMTVWALVATSFGLANVLGGNLQRIPAMVAAGQLDFYLSLPKPVLPHLLVSRMSTFAWGDVIFGVIVFAAVVARSWLHVVAFVLAVLLSAIVMTGFAVMASSLVFFFGQAEQASRMAGEAMLTFSLYPQGIYGKWVRAVLYSVIPAALISAVPATFVRELSWLHLGYLALAAAVFGTLGWTAFYAGLRRYESGNLMQMRS